MILTEQEIWQIGMQDISLDAPYGYARAIESAVREKLKAQEPVGVFADVNRLTPEAGTRWEHMVDEAYDGKDYIHLYRHPLPPDDVVRDAERYRWLVDNSYDRDGFLQFQVWKHSWEPHSQTGIPIEWKCRVRGPAIDAAIDAAMKEMK